MTELKVKTPTGTVYQLTLSKDADSATLGDLRAELAKVSEVPAGQQRLIKLGVPISAGDDSTLSSSGLASGAELFLVRAATGGGNGGASSYLSPLPQAQTSPVRRLSS